MKTQHELRQQLIAAFADAPKPLSSLSQDEIADVLDTFGSLPLRDWRRILDETKDEQLPFAIREAIRRFGFEAPE